MKRRIFLAIGAIVAASPAMGGGSPAREEIAAALHLQPGAHGQVVVGGMRYEASYVRVEERRDGEYALIFRLRK